MRLVIARARWTLSLIGTKTNYLIEWVLFSCQT